MKAPRPSSFPCRRLSSVAGLHVASLALFVGHSKADQNWDGDNPLGNFSFANNWYGNTVGGLSGFGFGNGNLNFSYRNNSSQTSIYYDFGGWADTNDIFWNSTFGAALNWDGNGQGLNFKQRLQNDSSFTQTVTTMNLSGGKNGATQIELNPVNGDLVLNGNLYNDNSLDYRVYGNNAKTLTVNTALGTGSNASNVTFSVEQNSKVIFTANQAYAGGTVINAGSLQIGNGGATGALGSGAVTNNAALVFNRSGNFVLGNAIGGTGTLAQSGSNIITISSANSYSGATTINSGVLRVTANDALGTGASGTTVNSGGQLRLDGVSYTTAENLTLNGIGGDGNGALVNVSGASSYAGAVTVATNSTIRNTGTSLDLNGGIQINASTTLTIAGTGPIRVNGIGSGTGAVNVNTGATLGGSGSIAGTVNITGTLAPGSSIESLGTGAVNFITGSTFAYELNSAVINGDLVDSTGTLHIASGSILTLTELASGTLANGSKLTLISYFGDWTSGELFSYDAGAGLATLADDSTFTLGANKWLFNYNDTSGGSNFSAEQAGATRFVTMTVIPEPSAVLLGGLGLLGLLRRRRG